LIERKEKETLPFLSARSFSLHRSGTLRYGSGFL
jgi:hypothetical protein